MFARNWMSFSFVLFAGLFAERSQGADPASPKVVVDGPQYKISLYMIERAWSDGAEAKKAVEPVVKTVDPKLWLDAMQDETRVKVLSSPTIVTTSGREARMSVGGEHLFTVGYADDKAVTKVVPVGVQLTVTATALGEERVSVDFAMHVSELADVAAIDLPAEAGKKPRKLELPTVREQAVKSTLVLSLGQAGVVSGEVRETDGKRFHTEVLVTVERFDIPR